MRILFTGGGTLGSVTPLLALFEELKPSQAYWIGTRRGVEQLLIAESGIPFFHIVSGKFRRYFDWRTLVAPFAIGIGIAQALVLLLRLRPTHIVSAGGYVGVPVIVAGFVLGIPSYTFQLDRRPGLANRMVAPFVRHIFVVFLESVQFFPKKKVVVTGSVVRRVFQNAAPAQQKKRPVLLVLGGGTGAQALNEIVWSALPALTALGDVIHITGKGKERTIASPCYTAHALVTNEFPVLLEQADVVLTRAGMGTLSELAAMRKAAIVVPLPDTHQEDNAALLLKQGAAEVIRQDALTPEKLVATVETLFRDSQKQRVLGEKLHQSIPTDGAKKIAQFIIHHS